VKIEEMKEMPMTIVIYDNIKQVNNGSMSLALHFSN